MAAVEKIITEFMLTTCRAAGPRRLTNSTTFAMECGAMMATKRAVNDPDTDMVPLQTGSSAEFYIDPMLPCVGDIDIMVYFSSCLAIPEGHYPPTQLLDDFASRVVVVEIVDSHMPGYVYLKNPRYLLEQEDEEGNYACTVLECSRNYARNRGYFGRNFVMHGPAMYVPGTKNVLSTDAVYCMRCLSWPPQAADWPTRHRNYDWPDSATVGRIVNDGCDVVGAVHRLCREDEWMSGHQWRLSFSRAEVAMINSWLPVQQIVYHMLRVFVKTERLTESTNNCGTWSNYHIKTLMLWSCELKSNSWWMDDLSIIRICVEILHNLAVWLTNKRCPHYFVSNCNLMDNLFEPETTASHLFSVDRAWLSKWFLNNYIRKCSQFFPFHVSRLFADVSTRMKLQDAVSAVVAWKRNTAMYEFRSAFVSEEYHITEGVSNYSLTVRSCNYWIKELSRCDDRLLTYFTATALLHVARKITKTGFNYNLMDVLAVILGQFIGTQHYLKQNTAVLLAQATKLMKVVANNSRSTVQLIEIELTKAYLYRALRSKDSDTDSIYCLANVYLAVLYYTTGQYQTAIDHCTLVMRSQDHSQCSSHVVQGELLPKIDDDIDNVLGLAVFYQYVRAAALSQQRRLARHVSVFTIELFAHSLLFRCLSIRNATHKLFTKFPQSVSNVLDMKQLFITDVLVLVSVSRCLGKHFNHSSPPYYCENPAVPNTQGLVELLQQSAVEHLTTFRQVEARDFGSFDTIVTTDFEALYAFKRGDYHQCLRSSEENVRTLLPVPPGDEISTFPEFIQLLDDDFASLTALMLLINPQCRKTNVIISRLTLSMYLMTQCQLKLRHSLTSLAQTLDYIEMARARLPPTEMLNLLVLKLTKRKVLLFIRKQ